MNREIFRQYDIRGKVDEDLTEEVVEKIGRAYGTYVRNRGLKRITCCRDGRTHSRWIQEALIHGICSTGCNIVNIGEGPTPLLYFSIFHLGSDGGVQVTGSHNPPDFNGFKMCVKTSTLYGPQIQDLRKIIESGDFIPGDGKVQLNDIIESYLSYLRKNIKIVRPLKIVLDAGNGVAGPVAPRAFEDQGCQVFPMYCDVDGTFPNHHPDPTVLKNLKDLRARVLETGADAGMAYDGDGDRLGVVDEKGEFIFGDKLLIIFARSVLKEHPGTSVIGEVKCSHTLYDDISLHGGRPIMYKTGHSLIKQKMREEKALLAGEMSGHIFFADRYFGYDDAIYASLRLAEIMASSDRPLSGLLEGVPKTYSTPEIRIPCPDNDKFQIVEEAKEWFKTRYKTIDVDGIRVVFDDGWGLIRASNTQPVLVFRFEATTPARLKEIQDLLEDKIREIADKRKK